MSDWFLQAEGVVLQKTHQGAQRHYTATTGAGGLNEAVGLFFITFF